MWNSMASRIKSSTSSRVSPAATQPGRSGTYAPNEVADEDVEAAWATEIGERAARARSGEDPGKPWPEVRERVERDIKNS